jgi:elongator complex protein 3
MTYTFSPDRYERQLEAIIDELLSLDAIDGRSLQRVLRKYPKDGSGLFSKSDIIRGFRHLRDRREWTIAEESFLERLRMKPVRTASGVAPVTVLTKPFPCPGRCIFCPSDVRMPKSYLSDEPGAQRAAQHQFDPYLQTLSRLLAYHNNGHRVDKVELIILGGTWSHYSEEYQIWFVRRCFDAMNDLPQYLAGQSLPGTDDGIDFGYLTETIDGRSIERGYNAIVTDFRNRHSASEDESADWESLARVQRANESAEARCVGLVLETRPDSLTPTEALRMRRLGATKVQIGVQSLDDSVLALNKRGHDVAATARAFELLRGFGFKIHAHWMPNLLGSSPDNDVRDFKRLFEEPAFRPDELKIYPCSLIESAELMTSFEDGSWRPYSREELLRVIGECLGLTPPYCRVTRVIRDIPGTDIVDGNRLTNFREIAEADLDERNVERREIRSREIRFQQVAEEDLRLSEITYATSTGQERFLQFVTPDDDLAAFLRLSLPSGAAPSDEIRTSAMIREVHVYGVVVGVGERHDGRSQHSGLGRKLIDQAANAAADTGFADLAVISSVGTRQYYRKLGFEDGELYQHLSIGT